jgi:hypothetical protein
MRAKSYILIPYHLWDHNIQSWRKTLGAGAYWAFHVGGLVALTASAICKAIIWFKKKKVEEKVFSKKDNSLLGSKKNTFSSWYETCLPGFLFLSELGTCPQNLMPTQGVEPCKNHQFPQGGMLKFTYKGRFLSIKIAYEKFLDWESKW